MRKIMRYAAALTFLFLTPSIGSCPIEYTNALNINPFTKEDPLRGNVRRIFETPKGTKLEGKIGDTEFQIINHGREDQFSKTERLTLSSDKPIYLGSSEREETTCEVERNIISDNMKAKCNVKKYAGRVNKIYSGVKEYVLSTLQIWDSKNKEVKEFKKDLAKITGAALSQEAQ